VRTADIDLLTRADMGVRRTDRAHRLRIFDDRDRAGVVALATGLGVRDHERVGAGADRDALRRLAGAPRIRVRTVRTANVDLLARADMGVRGADRAHRLRVFDDRDRAGVVADAARLGVRDHERVGAGADVDALRRLAGAPRIRVRTVRTANVDLLARTHVRVGSGDRAGRLRAGDRRGRVLLD